MRLEGLISAVAQTQLSCRSSRGVYPHPVRSIIHRTGRQNIGLFLVLLWLPTQPEYCSEKIGPWRSLGHLKRGLGYVFIMRNMTCQYGQLREVTDASVSIETDQSDVVIARANLLRVRLGFGGRSVQNSNPNLPLLTVYSGRSSWSDLLDFESFESKEHPFAAVRFSVTTKDGEAHQGILNQIS